MIEAWGGTLNLILYLISMLGLGYYAFLTVLSPNTLVTRYDLGEKSVPIIRIVGTFVLPILILGIYLLFRGPEGAWLFFVLNFLVSTHQVILGWATRFKIIDPDSKQDVGDEIVGDHLARGSMKNAANCASECELQDI
jgi:4-hydroxybenzoate polyprenyltransferase